MTTRGDGEVFLYIGTYTTSEEDGIHVYRWNGRTGKLTFVSIAPGVENPGFLAFHPTRPYLYAVNEVKESKIGPVGAVSAFSIDTKTGASTYLNQRSSRGANPCYLHEMFDFGWVTSNKVSSEVIDVGGYLLVSVFLGITLAPIMNAFVGVDLDEAEVFPTPRISQKGLTPVIFKTAPSVSMQA